MASRGRADALTGWPPLLLPRCRRSILRVIGTASLSHLAIKHASLRHHLPGLSWSGYLLQMGLQAVVPGAIALAVAMLMGRTDMPPQAHGAAGTARRAWTARDGLVACHRAQVFAQQHLRPLLIVVSGACVLYQMLRCFIEVGRAGCLCRGVGCWLTPGTPP